ncbi:hypothetical protein LX32DRAFT_102659 [Colletotrichum zoysiae]|uniref:Uncharacterized protein n=1 Tax=Colletotrichum zoysiae TaxID=1216348 RepID=A0AAD9HQK9_9PEZI|nr:hypothetical protein LX32DRAFT_102659 [Colletotrichum zoysiae]
MSSSDVPPSGLTQRGVRGFGSRDNRDIAGHFLLLSFFIFHSIFLPPFFPLHIRPSVQALSPPARGAQGLRIKPATAAGRFGSRRGKGTWLQQWIYLVSSSNTHCATRNHPRRRGGRELIGRCQLINMLQRLGWINIHNGGYPRGCPSRAIAVDLRIVVNHRQVPQDDNTRGTPTSTPPLG